MAYLMVYLMVYLIAYLMVYLMYHQDDTGAGRPQGKKYHLTENKKNSHHATIFASLGRRRREAVLQEILHRKNEETVGNRS